MMFRFMKNLAWIRYLHRIRSVQYVIPQGCTNVWFAEVDADNTTIYANFGDIDPNKETVEVSVRPTCFYPTREGLNYITICGSI